MILQMSPHVLVIHLDGDPVLGQNRRGSNATHHQQLWAVKASGTDEDLISTLHCEREVCRLYPYANSLVPVEQDLRSLSVRIHLQVLSTMPYYFI